MNKNEKEFWELDTGQKILERTSQYDVPFRTSKEDALKQLKLKIVNESFQMNLHKRDNKNRVIYWASSAAAAIIILVGIWQFLIRTSLSVVEATKGQHAEYQLPDGSNISLNADSKILFQEKEFKKKRYLKLEGEAFFSVAKGKSFIIDTKLADIRILGTSFNVFARESQFRVSCVTGKIEVTSKNEKLIIVPGESAFVDNGVLKKCTEKDMTTVATWRKGEFKYENSPLPLIFKEIERQFNVTFVTPNLENRSFSGSFTNQNLVNTLNTVCKPMRLTYEIGTNGKISIREGTQ